MERKNCLQILSDIHLEFAKYQYIPSKNANIVIDAGDLCSQESNIEYKAIDHIKEILKHDKILIYVPGNHEYYNGDYKNKIEFKNENLRNFYLLDNKSIILNGIKFVGSTLWSNVNEYISYYVNDTNMIKNNGKKFSCNDIRSEFKKNLEYIVSELEDSLKQNLSTVIITHYLPSFDSIHPKYKNYIINSAFASDLNDIIIKYSPILWIHGHTHSSLDYKIGNTRIVCNPRGYVENGKTENSEFKDIYEVFI